MMREIELLQRQFQDAANQFPGLMHIWVLYSQPRLPLTDTDTLRDQIILSYWGPTKWITTHDSGLWEYWFIRRKHHQWDADDAVRRFEWLAEKAHIRAHLLRELLPEMNQIDMTRFSGGTSIVTPREAWLLDVYRLNLVAPLSKGDDHFYWFSRPEAALVAIIGDQLSPSEADIFYLDDVFLESAFACSNLLELLSIKEAGRKPKAKEPPKESESKDLVTESQSARTTALLCAAAQLNQIADNFESWAKKHHAKYVDPNGVKPPAFTLAQIEDWVNTYLSKQRLIAVFFSHPGLSYDKNSGLTPFITTYERKEFHLIIDVFRLHMPAIATSLKELYDEFWGDVEHHIKCHKRSKKVQEENIPSIGESVENTSWHPPLFLDGTVARLIRRLRHIAAMVREELATEKPVKPKQNKKKIKKAEKSEKRFQPWKNSGDACFIIDGNKIMFHYKDKPTTLRLKAESNTYRLLRLLAGGSLQADEIQKQISPDTSNKASKIVNYANGLLNKKIPMVGFVGVPSNVEFIKRDRFGSYSLSLKIHTKESFYELQWQISH